MIVNRQRKIPFSLDPAGRLARALAHAVGIAEDVFTVALVSDRRIAALNRRFGCVSRPTDVLSFPVGRPGAGRGGNGYLGDVVISLETARHQARREGHSVQTEVGLLIVHGVLHLLGFDHETDNGQMMRREHALRRRLGLE